MKKLLIIAGILSILLTGLVVGQSFNQGDVQIVINGDFSKWTDPTFPDDWVQGGTHDVNNYVEENSAGGITLVSDGTSVGINQTILTIGKTYKLAYDVIAITGNGCKWVHGTETNITTTGNFKTTITPSATSFGLFRRTGAGTCEIQNAFISEYIPPTKNAEAQLLLNGDMGSATGWTLQTGSSITGGKMVIDGSQVSGQNNFQTGIVTSGQLYRVDLEVSGYVAGSTTPFAGDAGIGTPITANGFYSEVIEAVTGTNFYIVYDATFEGDIDNVLVTEYTPPLKNLESQDLVDGDMEKDGTSIVMDYKFDLTQAANIAADSGAITGSLTYTCAGADFDGAADYVTYTVDSGLLNKSSLSIAVEFTPDFDYDENANRYLYDSSDGSRYYALKKNNASNNAIEVYMGNTKIADIASASYSGDWNANARNVLVVSGTSGDTDAWLNGTQILTNDNTAWSPASPTSFYAGTRFSGSSLFDGEIHSFTIYDGLLDGTDAQNLYDSVDTDDWTALSNACITKQLGASEGGFQIMNVSYVDASFPTARQAILTIGKEYKITGWARGDGTKAPKIQSGDASLSWTGTSSTDWQRVDVTGITTNINLDLVCNTTEAGFAEFDDVFVTEL